MEYTRVQERAKMRAAVVGLGRMGMRHLQALRDLGAEIVGIAEPDAERGARAAEEYKLGAGAVHRDATDLLRAVKLDCLVVAATAPAHAPVTLAALDAGVRYVLCEKPLASSLAECDAIVAAAQRTGGHVAVNHQMRFMEQYTAARRIIESDEFGGWASATVIAGNFGIAMNGTHYFELLRWLAGAPVVEVSAWFSPDIVASPRGPQFSDRAGQLRLTTANGKRMYLDIGADQGHGIRVVYAGRTGMLVADELTGKIDVAVRNEEHRNLPTTRYGMPETARQDRVAPADAVEPTKRVLEALWAETSYPTAEDGRRAVEVLVAAFVSAESGGRPVRLDSDALPRDRRFDYA